MSSDSTASFGDLLIKCKSVSLRVEDLLGPCDPAAERVEASIKSLRELVLKGAASSSDDDRSAILDALCEVDSEVTDALRSLTTMAKVGTELCQLVRELAEAGAKMQGKLDTWQFLAEFGDYVSAFLFLTVLELQKDDYEVSTWAELSSALVLEELQEEPKEVTSALQAALLRMGFTWLEWCALREVGNASVRKVHAGSPRGIVAALAQIDQVSLPHELQHTREALKKALNHLSKAKPILVMKKKTLQKSQT